MLKFLVGPALVGAAYVAGSLYGANAQQVVRKSPGTVYSAVHRAIAANVRSGTMHLEGGQPVPYELKLDQSVDEQITARLLFDGAQGAEAKLDFTPAESGAATLVTLTIDAEQSVLRKALAGTSKAKLGYAPDFMFNIAARRILRELAAGIEAGASFDAMAGFTGTPTLSPEQQAQQAAWQQYAASRPTVDPDAAARDYLGGR